MSLQRAFRGDCREKAMKLQQLRYLVEVYKQGLNVSEAAEFLHTSQPGISRQVRLLEEELGVQVFVRNGKRVVGVTPPGREILRIAEAMLLEARNLKRVAEEFANEQEGSLTLATTHTQARYALPATVRDFLGQFPGVRLSIKQGSPTHICDMVVAGEADLAIATEAIDQFPDLAMFDCYTWNRSLIVPDGHPLLDEPHPVTLQQVAAFPIITYDFAFAGRSKINQAFEAAGIEPNVVLSAIDTDVIKTYVSLGLGVGIIASMAFDPQRDTGLTALDAAHLFAPSTTRIGLRRDAYLRGYAYAFIESFAPHLKPDVIKAALMHGD
jgi:LysR family cys regulon transcriptional activator